MMRAMLNPFGLLRRLAADQRGTMVVETAIVTPVLVLLSLGTFQVSQLVARQAELDGAAAEGAAIAIASAPDTAAKRTTLQQVIMTSTGLTSNEVTVSAAFRCNSSASYVTDPASCASGVVSNFVKIYVTDTFTPAWTEFGIGSNITYRVTRYVEFAQADIP